MLYAIVIHIILCALVYVGMRTRLLKVQPQLMPMVILVPVWGVLCVLLLHILHISGREGTAETGIEKLRENEDAHRSLLVEDLSQQRSVVPLQEALILNDARLRRGMMLDVLYENPDDYHTLLQEAIANEDSEVVHYATTAMAELQKDYDETLRRIEKEYAANQDDLELLQKYCRFLQKYLDRNLLQGQMETMQRYQLAHLLERLLQKAPALTRYQQLITALMNVGEFTKAREYLDRMLDAWPHEEATLLCQLELAVRTGDRPALDAVLQKAHSEQWYLSARVRERLRFYEQNHTVPAEGDA